MSEEMKEKIFNSEAIPHQEALYNYALKISGNMEDAEDLVQDTYLKAYNNFGQYNVGTNCKAWMFMIMKNSFINNYRKSRREPNKVYYDKYENFHLSFRSTELSISPEDSYLKLMLDDETTAALAHLPEKMQRVIVLCDLEGYSYDEIAEMLNIPVGTVRSRLHRARKILEQILFDYAKDRGYFN